MAPSTTVQSRIHAFEALGSNHPPFTSKSNSQSPPQHLLEEPISPSAKSFSLISPSTSYETASHSPSPSPPNLGRKSSLIDLRDWVVDDGPTRWTSSNPANSQFSVRRPPQPRRTDPSEHVLSMPLISLEPSPPTKAKVAPPLPPKIRSYNSLNGKFNANGDLAPRKPSDSLVVEHTYPPFLTLDTSTSRKGLGHAPASSISSFHSVSLSDSEYCTQNTASFVSRQSTDRDAGDVDSLDESYENVSALSSPVALVGYDPTSHETSPSRTINRPIPPKLPERPKSRSAPEPSHSRPPSPKRYNSGNNATGRRLPPPPPPSGISRPPSVRTSIASTTASDRSSVLSSIATSTTSRTSFSFSTQSPSQLKSSSQLSRPTPIPTAARHRYESLFFANVRAKGKTDKSAFNTDFLAPLGSTPLTGPGRKVRTAAGWRGLSVDLTTNPAENNTSAVTDTGGRRVDRSDNSEDALGSDEHLDGLDVKQIWNCSKLERSKLREIWNDCDPDRCGYLAMDAFVKGMWCIDEELRKAQLGGPMSTLSSNRRNPRRLDSNLVPR